MMFIPNVRSLDRDFVTNFLSLRFARIFSMLPEHSRVALYPAGAHTQFLLSVLNKEISNRIAFLIDKEPFGKKLALRVYAPESIPWRQIDAVVISSDSSEEKLFASALSFVEKGISIQKLYDSIAIDDSFIRAKEIRRPQQTAQMLTSEIVEMAAFNAISKFLGASRDGHLDITRIGSFVAALESEQFRARNMRHASSFNSYPEYFEFSSSLANVAGLIIDWGFPSSYSLKLLARFFPDHKIFGLGTFETTSETWDRWQERMTPGQPGSLSDDLPDNVALVKGSFSEILPVFLSENSAPCRLIHVNCNSFESTETMLDTLHRRFRPGTVIIFNDFFNFPGWQGCGPFRAITEFATKHKIAFEYKALLHTGKSVCIQITSVSE